MPGVGVTKPTFSVPLFSQFFRMIKTFSYLYDIKFIFGRCHRSWAAETPGKYEHDWNCLTYTFAKSKFPVTEKLAIGALVTPSPGQSDRGNEYAFVLPNNQHSDIFAVNRTRSLRRRHITNKFSWFTCLPTVYSTVCTHWHQRKHQNSASLVLCEGNPPITGGFPHKGPVIRKVHPFHDAIMWPTWLKTKQTTMKRKNGLYRRTVIYNCISWFK